MAAKVTIQFIVPAGYSGGDYAMLHGSAADGEIDWDNPLSSQRYELFPNGAGLYGFGLAPFGLFRWGLAHPMRTPGFGELPWGLFPAGLGSIVIRAAHIVTECGVYKFGFKCFDSLGNAHEGTPDEAELTIHTAPPAPAGLNKNSYDSGSDILILDVDN